MILDPAFGGGSIYRGSLDNIAANYWNAHSGLNGLPEAEQRQRINAVLNEGSGPYAFAVNTPVLTPRDAAASVSNPASSSQPGKWRAFNDLFKGLNAAVVQPVLKQLASSEAGMALDTVDSIGAGWASGFTDGQTDEAREFYYGDDVKRNQTGWLYNTFRGVGIGNRFIVDMMGGGLLTRGLGAIRAVGDAGNAYNNYQQGNYFSAANDALEAGSGLWNLRGPRAPGGQVIRNGNGPIQGVFNRGNPGSGAYRGSPGPIASIPGFGGPRTTGFPGLTWPAGAPGVFNAVQPAASTGRVSFEWALRRFGLDEQRARRLAQEAERRGFSAEQVEQWLREALDRAWYRRRSRFRSGDLPNHIPLWDPRLQ